MTAQTKTRRVGRKRWGELVRFLTTTMKTSGNERVRMAAAQRLADILILREEREQLVLRRELRDAGKAVDAPEPGGQPEPSPDVLGKVEEDVDTLLARIRRMKQQETENDDEQN